MRVVVSGASGLVGTALCRSLSDDEHEVVRLVRRAPTGEGEVGWDPGSGAIGAQVLDGADAVVNLNGVSIGARRWTDDQKRAILDSRTSSTSTLASAICESTSPPAVFVSTSAVGYYGTGEGRFVEGDPPGHDFLAEVCVAWEAATAPAAQHGVRTVCLRSGVVLTSEGPPLSRMLLPFRLGLGGRIGSGQQWMSWIALDDTVRIIRRAIDDPSLEGAVNSTSPEPVRQEEFAATLGRVLGRPTVLPTPVPALKLAYGSELVEYLLVEGQCVLPKRLEAAGYEFAHPDLEEALRATLGR